MAYEPTQRRDVPGSQPLRLNQPETGAAQRPWFRDEPAAPIGAPQPAVPRARPSATRPLDVQALPDDVLRAPRQSNWLLELEGDTPVEPPPEVEISEPVAPQTSYVEPETPSTLLSRALAPAGLALVVSFLAVGGFAFWKSGGSTSAPAGADPLDADPSFVSGQRAAQLVAPPNSDGSTGPARIGLPRAGTAPTAAKLGQQSARQTATGPGSLATPPTTPKAAGTTSASIAPNAELRSAVTTPVSETGPKSEPAPKSEPMQPEGALGGAPTRASTARAGQGAASMAVAPEGAATGGVELTTSVGERIVQGLSASEMDELLLSLSGAESSEVHDSPRDGGVAETRPPLDPSLAPHSESVPTADLIDQFFDVLIATGASASPPGSAVATAAATEVATEAATEVALAPEGGADDQHATEVESAVQPVPDASDPAPLFTGDDHGVAIASSQPDAEGALGGMRLDLDWDELTLLAVEPAPASDAAAQALHSDVPDLAPMSVMPTVDAPTVDAPTFDAPTTLADSTIVAPAMVGPALDTPTTLADPTIVPPAMVGPTFDTPTFDTLTLATPTLDAPTTLTDATLDAPTMVGPAFDWPLLDWPTPAEPVLAPLPTGSTLAGPAPDVTAPGNSAASELAASDVTEGQLSSDGTSPATSGVAEVPSKPTHEGSGGPDSDDPHSTALALELDGLFATVGPRSQPVDAPGPVAPRGATEATPTTTVAAGGAVASSTPSDVQVEVMPPVATPSTDKGLRSVLRRADEAGTWTALDVPNTAVIGPELLLTPYTGNVRVVFGGGDVFEGRLHAVGQNTITLDTKLGRMTLDARRLERIERLAPEGPAPKSPAKVASDTSGLEEVRVTTRGGGTFVGHLVSRDANRVTIIVAEGYRMTVEATEVIPALGGRATSSLRRTGEKPLASVKPATPAPPTQR